MKKYLKIVFVLWMALLFTGNSSAQLFDVFSGESIEVSHVSLDFKPKIKFAGGDMDLDCMKIKNEPTSKTELLNTKILELYKSYLSSE